MTELPPGQYRLGNGHEFILSVHQASLATGKPEAATGLTITAFLSATDTGTALTGTTVTPLIARTTAAYGDEYAGILSATLADAAAANATVAANGYMYERFTATNLNYSRKLVLVSPAAA